MFPGDSHLLVQMDDDDTDYRFPIAIANEPVLKNLRLSVMCMLFSGKVDRAAGLVFRYQDENSYYVTRANALENNVRFYKVEKGRRQQLAGWDGKVTSGFWHEFQVEAIGDHIQITWDGQKVIDAHDSTFPEAGKVGLWTKADSVTAFDDLIVEALGS